MYSITMQYLEKGGIVNCVIAVVCFVVLYIGFEKYFLYISISRSKKALDLFLANTEPLNAGSTIKKDWLLDRFLKQYQQNPGRGTKYYLNWFREILMEHIPQIENGLDTMAAWIAVAPLLGLLGTVVGMVETFSIITRYGVGNPNLLSEGISVALITTQSGLVVAFPCLLFHNYLIGRKKMLIKNIIVDSERIIHWLEARNN